MFYDSEIYVCAPTGRASKRLTEVTGVKATTIHSLLKWDLHSNTFSINKDNPLFLIDCRTRQGQSGSPVVAFRKGTYRTIDFENN